MAQSEWKYPKVLIYYVSSEDGCKQLAKILILR